MPQKPKTKLSEFLDDHDWINQSAGILVTVVFLAFLFIAMSKDYKVSDFFTVAGLVIAGLVGIVLLLMAALILWEWSDSLMKKENAFIWMLGCTIRISMWGVFLAGAFYLAQYMPYDPDCPAGIRYC